MNRRWFVASLLGFLVSVRYYKWSAVAEPEPFIRLYDESYPICPCGSGKCCILNPHDHWPNLDNPQ